MYQFGSLSITYKAKHTNMSGVTLFAFYQQVSII